MHPSERVFTRWPDTEGYCTPLSAEAGSTIGLRAASRAGRFAVDVRRWGSPDAAWTSDVDAVDHPVPDSAWAVGCDWPVAVEIPTGPSWQSGMYEVTMRAFGVDGERATSQAFFVLRPAATGPKATAVLHLATNTYNAYNQWGGKCCYSGATHVSFERPLERGYLRRSADASGFDGRITDLDGDPTHQRLVDYWYAHDLPSWTNSGGWWNWERRFVEWAEREGFVFDVVIDADLERNGVLDDYDVLLTVGHNEYWTRGMRDAADAFVEQGGRWAIFSGNTSFWQVRYDQPGQMTAYKGRAHLHDPVAGTARHDELTSFWSDPSIAHPETSTIGLTFTRGGYHRVGHAVADGTGAYEVHAPDHWVFEGTGLGAGEQLGVGSYAVGYEVDGVALDWVDGTPVPTHEDGAPSSLQILATAPARLMSITDDVCEPPPLLWNDVRPPGELEAMAFGLFGDMSEESVARIARGHAVMAIFAKGDGEVFNAGSADWAYGLDGHPLVQQVTANVLRRFGLN
ncbi:MAG: N,N-dimethylformamidase beta subunit family domain-containing protein [Actinomycetota bacterium]